MSHLLKRHCRFSLLIALIASPMGTFAAAKTASVQLTSRSVGQEPIAWFASGVGAVTTFVTTFDGLPGLPLHDSVTGTYSSEVRPRSGQPLTFEADYIHYMSNWEVAGYGSVVFTLPGGDSDGNSLPDIFQFDKGLTVNYTGFVDPDLPAVANSITRGTLTKRANEKAVHHTFTATNPEGVVRSFDGTIQIGYSTGTAVYTRGSQGSIGTVEIFLTGFENGLTYSATTTFDVVNANEITLPQFTARRSDGFALQVFASTLRRAGTKYIAELEVADGLFSSSWRDYTKLVLELIDSNDSNGNGIPDFSDALPQNMPPTVSFLRPAANVVTTLNSAIVLESSATDSDGNVSKVEYFSGPTSLGTSMISPYTVNKSGWAAGVHTIVAVATDNNGATTTSAPIKVTIVTRPQLMITLGTRLRLNIAGTGAAGAPFVLESSSQVSGTVWTPILTNTPAADGTLTFSGVNAGPGVRYFRAVVR